MSSLERGLKSPTIQRIEELVGRMGIHPLSLIRLQAGSLDGGGRS
ncbi:hypothetical protein [Pseudomonas putida]